MERTCVIAACGRPHQARGYCAAHYQRALKGKPIDAPLKKRRENLDACSVGGCDRTAEARGMCRMHYFRWRMSGDAGAPESQRPGGSRTVKRNGYVVIHMPDHPNADAKGAVLEHRLVMSTALGRPLAAWENVHHRNGVKDDNRPENLELWVTPQPTGQRPEDIARWLVDHYPTAVMDAIQRHIGVVKLSDWVA